MKKILFSFLVLQLFSALNLYSQQSGWVWQNPLPQGNDISGMKMFDIKNGICINSDNILITENGGVNWIIHYSGIPSVNKTMSVAEGKIIYMLADSSVILKSVNGGKNWKELPRQSFFKNSFLYFMNEDTGFAAGWFNNKINNVRLYKTTDGAMTWNNVLTDTTYSITSIQFVNNLKGFATGSQYIYTTTGAYHMKFLMTNNGGNTWDTIPNLIRWQNSGLHFLNEQTGFLFGYNAGYSDPWLYKTTNAGVSLIPILNPRGAIQIQFIDNMNGFLLYGQDIYKTTDCGTSWVKNPVKINGEYVSYLSEISFLNNNTGFAAGSGGKILKTTNSGVNWAFHSGGYLTDQELWDISFSGNTGFAIGSYGKLLRTTNSGTNWNLIEFDKALDFSAIAKVNSNVWYLASWYNGKILKTTDSGITWDTTYPDVYGPTRLEFINEYTGFGICKYNDFIKTTNGGNNWIVTSPFGSQNWAMDFIDENTGFVCGSGGKMDKTTDGGITWIRYLPRPNEFYAADIQFINNSTGFIAAEDYILKSTNSGVNWFSIYYSVPHRILDIFFPDENTGIALGYDIVLKTTNCGANWYELRTCTSNAILVSYFSDSLTGWIAGTNGAILKTTTGGEPIFVEPPVEIPTTFYLFQNYPNPFNPTTTIRYGLPNNSIVKLKIYDILGRLVKELYNGEQEAGNHSLIFDGSVYASGVYFCTLETPEFTQSQKMVLLK